MGYCCNKRAGEARDVLPCQPCEHQV
ncbi:hypothetical protein NC653_027905 [Populus alba x Populus x berolinensis]|uniref:Uncharacterized protein n=1 Tax=Populus alba x Populus x berolinensis TaxID=444605 RepID=A0AAD6M6M5_9ROSI|nr:hypothetical protein NC653_027905 [Populus alba x Populus x berolinensis]